MPGTYSGDIFSDAAEVAGHVGDASVVACRGDMVVVSAFLVGHYDERLVAEGVQDEFRGACAAVVVWAAALSYAAVSDDLLWAAEHGDSDGPAVYVVERPVVADAGGPVDDIREVVHAV